MNNTKNLATVPLEYINPLKYNYNMSLSKQSDVISERRAATGKPNYLYQRRDELLSRLKTVYRELPWYTEKIISIYVQPITMDPIFYDVNRPILFENNEVYPVLSNYYIMRISGVITNISEDNVVTLDYDNSIQQFKIILKTFKKKIIVQNKEMFSNELSYVKYIFKMEEDILKLKQDPVSDRLKMVLRTILLDYAPDEEYTDNFMQILSEQTSDSYEFCYAVMKIVQCAKYGKVFGVRLKKKYYPENILYTLDFPTMLLGIEPGDFNIIQNIIETSTIDTLLYSVNYYKPTERISTRPSLVTLDHKINKFDIKSKCVNVADVQDIDEEDIIFYTENNHLYCFDIKKLYTEFMKNININPYTNKKFSHTFVEKVKTLYNFNLEEQLSNRSSLSSSSSYATVHESVEDNFLLTLEKVREEIKKLDFVPLDRCVICKKNIPGTENALVTVSETGNVSRYCSQNCFEQ
nr:MAG: hypothetical protein DiTV3a_F3ORF6 [Diabrotica toursvirus 3a]